MDDSIFPIDARFKTHNTLLAVLLGANTHPVFIHDRIDPIGKRHA